jgi:hypothetical protein
MVTVGGGALGVPVPRGSEVAERCVKESLITTFAGLWMLDSSVYTVHQQSIGALNLNCHLQD